MDTVSGEELSELERRVYLTIGQSFKLEDGDEKIALLEEAVRIADTGTDIELQYFARKEFLNAAYWGGAPEKAMVAYAWCLGQFDMQPGMFSERDLLWTYKWMVNSIFHFPQISKEQIYAMLDDMTRRYREAGYGLRVVYQYRYRFERFCGNGEEAIRHYRYAQELASDDLSNCPACELDEHVSFQNYCGEEELAISTAQPLLEGRYKCRTVPQRTIARLLLPLIRLGRREEAWDYHLQGYRAVSRNKSFLNYVSDHLIYLTVIAELERAAELLEEHYAWSEGNTDAHNRFLFYRAAWFFLDVIAESQTPRLSLSLPRTFPLYEVGGHYESSRLADWFQKEAREIARKFNERNGTDHFTHELEGDMALKNLSMRAEG
jgi:hypothetical protein